MTTDQQSDHPGPEWAQIGRTGPIVYYHPGLGVTVDAQDISYRGPSEQEFHRHDYGSVYEACRQISAAALAWERMRQSPITEELERIQQQLMCIEVDIRGFQK